MRISQHLKTILTVSCVLIYSVMGLAAYGQDQFNKFKHISTSDGFSLNSVNDIGQDENGLIWLGTRNGLMRYDGTELRVVYRVEGDFEQEQTNDIFSINVDTTTGIWIGSKNGLSLYSYIADSCKQFEWEKPSSQTTSSRWIHDVLRVSEEEVWIATRFGIDIYDVKNKVITSHKHYINDRTSISSNDITDIYQTKDGTIWVGTHRGLNQLVGREGDKLKFKRYDLGELDDNQISQSYISCIEEDHNGNIWVGTHDGLFYKGTDKDQFERFGSKPDQELTNEIIQDLTLDHDDRLWVATYYGLNIIDSTQKVLSRIIHDPTKSNGLAGNSVRSLFTDKQGGVWIATYFGGINYWNNNLLNFERMDERNGTQLGYRVVSAIEEDDESNVYFGTDGEGINIYDPVKNTFKKVDELDQGNQIGIVKSLLYQGEKKFWIGTFNRGLINIDFETGAFKQYRRRRDQDHSISSNQVLTIAKGIGNQIWLGTLTKGLDLFDPDKGVIQNFHTNGANQYIVNNSVRALCVNKKGDLIVGTGGGICLLTYDSYKNGEFDFKILRSSDGQNDGIYVHDIIEDSNGKIWIASQSNGLYYLEDDKIVSTQLEGVTSIFSIIEDKEGKLWLSSQQGIVSYDIATGDFRILDKKDGVDPNEFNTKSRLFSSSGKVYFGGASGVTVFNPSTLGFTNDYAPNLIITRFNLMGKDLQANDSTGILKKSIEYTDELTLAYDQNIFTIHFSMPSFINSEKNTYAYRLKGLDNNWVTTNNAFVSFTIQRGATYVFEVKGVNSNGVATNDVTTLRINVKNAPWLTWWAYLIYLIVFVSSLLLIIYSFQSRLKLQHKLETEIREFHNQQEANQQKLQFFTNISHEFRTPLTLIAGPLEKLIADYKGPSYVFRQLQVIKRNTDQLFKLINELMDFRKLENKQMKLQTAEGDIVKFANEIYLSFKQQAKISKLDYSFRTESPHINVYFDRDKLEKVLFNLISNAFKYTPQEGKIEVIVREIPGSVAISVIDSGDGIAPDHLDKIFDRFYEIPKQKSTNKSVSGSGIGLAIAKNVMDLHRGELKVNSELGKGSEFTMELRLGKAHLSDDEIIISFKSSEDISQYSKVLPAHDSEYGHVTKEENDHRSEKRSRVLIVEDNRDIAHFMHNVLNDHYEISLAENGALGFQEALASQPDLIISDVMMPVMDGIEFCYKIKSDIRTSHIPFILLTARTSLVYKYDGLESGADEYLSKPFEIKELLLKCKNIINGQERLKKRFSETGELPVSEASTNSIDEVMMGKAIQIIRENIGNEFFGIQLLCDSLGISRSLLFTKFKAWTNQTPNDYILSARMKKAATLIEQNKVNISQVGYMVGFKSANYFSKSFKKYYSMSPKTYSKKFTDSLGIK